MQSTNGVIYQWTFLLSQLAQELVITNGTFGFDPYQGPQCCITLQSSTPGDLPWPDRADCPIPSVVAELTLLSGDSMAYKDLPDLRKAIFGAIQKYFCQCDQKVWYVVFPFSVHGSRETISLQDICNEQADYRGRKSLWWSRKLVINNYGYFTVLDLGPLIANRRQFCVDTASYNIDTPHLFFIFTYTLRKYL